MYVHDETAYMALPYNYTVHDSPDATPRKKAKSQILWIPAVLVFLFIFSFKNDQWKEDGSGHGDHSGVEE